MDVFVHTSCSLVELLQTRASHHGDRCAYTFLNEEGQGESITYRELDQKARAVAGLLQTVGEEGDRALLLYPPGLDYIVAFWGCLYAGMLAVPAYPPRRNGNLARLQAVVADAEAKIALTHEKVMQALENRWDDSQGMAPLQWVATDQVSATYAGAWKQQLITGETLAFLQYTSGSTSSPKGVMLTHNNLLHNLQMIEDSFGTKPESECVIWLPPYHDMGLIGGILQPLFTGYHVTLMAPVTFIQSPYRWLQAISETGATVSGAPNFAYDLCVQKISPEQRDTLDLSSWQVAFTGAEPIRYETLERFAEYFAPCGFRKEAFYPCYGLAEGTLFVTGGVPGQPIQKGQFHTESLKSHEVLAGAQGDSDVQTLVSSGQARFGEQRVVVVDPETGNLVPEQRVGEIWVSGPSVAKGYWRLPEKTQETFHAYLADGETGPFLRTGDLGFLREGELYVTGRLKDLIIIRGRNYYPQDIEFTVQESHPAVHAGYGAAFSVEGMDGERLVVVQEVDRTHRKGNLSEVIATIRQAVSEQHQLQVHAVVLVKPASIPKTSSGKVQRHACRERFLAGTLADIASDVLGSGMDEAAATLTEHVQHSEMEHRQATVDHHLMHKVLTREMLQGMDVECRQAAVETYLISRAASILKMPASRLHAEESLNRYGLDSMMAVELKHDLETGLGIDLPLTLFLEGLSVRELTAHVLEQGSSSVAKADFEPHNWPDGTETELSYGQRALWFIQRLAPENTAYHISKAARITNEVDLTVLRNAFAELIQRHPILRTVFPVRNGQPVQVVQSHLDWAWQVEEARSLDEAWLQEQLTTEANRPFDLEKGPLFRLRVWKYEQDVVLQWTVHHLLVDFWSYGVLLQELSDIYAALKNGQELKSTSPARYEEYVQWQANMLSGAEGEGLLTYWQKQLGSGEHLLQLPTDLPRPQVQTYRGAVETFELPSALSERLKELAQKQGVTLYTLLLAAFQTLLYRYTGQEDIVVGSPTTGRSSSKFADVVGYFVNPVAMRVACSDELPFTAFLEQVKATVLGALQHQDYPFALLVEKTQTNRDLRYPPIFQVMFALQKSHLANAEKLGTLAVGRSGVNWQVGELALESLHVNQGTAQMDLSVTMAEHDGNLTGALEFNTELFRAETINRIIRHFWVLLENISLAPDQKLGALPLMEENEKQQRLSAGTRSVASFPQLCIHQAIEQQAAQHPDSVAVVDEERRLTYRELNQQANHMAHLLRQKGVGPDVLVGLYLPRSVEFVISMLAVLKAGGAYVPMETALPQERVSFMLRDSQAHVVVTQSPFVEGWLQEAGAQVVCFDEHVPQESAAVDNLNVEVTPENLAYVIYTSGTTGQPKGVCCQHDGVLNLFADVESRQPLAVGDGYATWASFGFDASVFEMYAALLHGGCLHIVPEHVRYESQAWFRWLAEKEIRHAYLPPFMVKDLALWLNEGHKLNLKRLLVGVEPIPEMVLAEISNQIPAVHIINGYGPSETTVIATMYSFDAKGAGERTTPIGTAVQNMDVYLLDAYLQPVPVGVPGEIHVGGVGVARGYLHRPDLTAEKFIPNPFARQAGERLYKTGDLARYLPDGSLMFVGRRDHQVKIRGLRIEMGEVEASLDEHPAVRESVVVVHERSAGDKRLVAYYLPSPDQEVTGADLRQFLKAKMPEYMIPALFQPLAEWPLNANGKVDRRALPAPVFARQEADAAYAPPTNELERKITAIWQAVLGVEQVGIHDNFFDLGGHSLLMTSVHHKVQELTDRPFTVVEMFRYPTVAGLTQFLQQQSKEKVTFEQVLQQADKKRDALSRRREQFKDRRK